MKKFICTIPTDELKRLYIDEKHTLPEMCEIIGVKNVITASKILRERGIDTYLNGRRADAARDGMDEEEFKQYLITQYSTGKSMGTIGEELGVTPSCIRKYFVKYGITRREKTVGFKARKKTKRIIRSDGYIMILVPDHPSANRDGYVFEHRVIMEKKIGRYLSSDEVVHHIDENKHNNDISNLLLLTNQEHMALHGVLRAKHKQKKE